MWRHVNSYCFCGQIKDEFRRRGLASRAQFAEARELEEEFKDVFTEQMVCATGVILRVLRSTTNNDFYVQPIR